MLEFIIPIKIDLKIREKHLDILLNHINRKYDFPINVIECDLVPKLKNDNRYKKYFYKVNFEYFNRSYTINRLKDFCQSNFICICDADIIFDYTRFNKALKQLENFDFIFPYTGPIYNISIKQYLEKTFSKDSLYAITSNSGILLCKRDSFIQSGMFNENFKGWGGEEQEFYHRIHKLGFKIGKIKGPLYHLNHFRKNIFKNKDLIENNRIELEKIKQMDINELKNYIEKGFLSYEKAIRHANKEIQ